MPKVDYHIPDMCCATEEQIIRNCLKSVDGVEDMSFDVLNRNITIDVKAGGEDRVVAALHSVGLPPKVEDAPEKKSYLAQRLWVAH